MPSDDVVVPFGPTSDQRQIETGIYTVHELQRRFKGLLRKAPYDAAADTPKGKLTLYLDGLRSHCLEARLIIYRHGAFTTTRGMGHNTITNSLRRDGLKDEAVIALLDSLWWFLGGRGYECRESRLHSGQCGSVLTTPMRWTPTKGGYEHIDMRLTFPDSDAQPK